MPALSEQLPVADRLSPSLLSTVAASHVAMSESASVPAKVTVTSVLFQPAAFAIGRGRRRHARGGLVDVDARHGGRGAVASEVGHGELVALARAFGGEGKGPGRGRARPDSASLAE